MEDSLAELVGANPIFREGRYLDDYLIKLKNSALPAAVFGKYSEAISQGEDLVYEIFINTLGCAEYEGHLIDLAISSAQLGEWHGFPRDYDYSLSKVIKRGFAHLVSYENQIFLLPSEKYIEHCKTRLSHFLKQSL